MKSLQKTAKTLDTFFNLFKIVAIIASIASIVVIAFVGGALIFDWNLENLGETDQILKLGSVNLTLASGFEFPIKSVLYYSLVNIAMLLIMSVTTIIAIGYIRSILAPMSEGEPFRNIVALNLKKLAWVTILYGVVRFFLDGLETFLIGHFYGDTLSSLIEGSGIAHIAYESESDMSFLLVAGVLFLLSYVFRYAQELQKLSDETL